MSDPNRTDTILIVDDTLENLRLLSDMMTIKGYSVQLAPNGKDALECALTTPPDLILLDINMPDLNGFEVCAALKADARTHDIPVIFISALTLIQDKVMAFTNGGVDYIAKPFQVREVLARVETHLKLRHLQIQLEGRVHELEIALEKVKKLEGLLPFCSYCKRIRDDQDYWHQVEEYIMARSEVSFSHGICPDCYNRHVQPQLDKLQRERQPK